MIRLLVAFVSGAVFTVGLAIGGMTRPSKVLGFLDVTGRWDPSLAFVMGGALLVTSIAFRFTLQRRSPVLDSRFHLPTERSIDARLAIGSVMFGAGWGLSGYCPGPALASVVTLAPSALVFVGSMMLGMLAFEAFETLRARQSSRETLLAQQSPAAS